MSTLMIIEHDNRVMQPSTRQLLAAALHMGEKPIVLVVGHDCLAVASEAATLEGVQEVWLADNACYHHQLAETVCPLLKSIAKPFTTIMASSSTYGKNILPRLAAMLDVAQISDVTRCIDNNTFEHLIYAGNAIEAVRVLDEIKVLTIRTTTFDAVLGIQPACPIKSLSLVFTETMTTFVKHQLNQSSRPDLGSAKTIVSGGRGLQSAEKFQLIEELADALGAAVGASRAAVDAGFVSNDYQVGQTGKVVAPNLYIAVGISGAVQHLAGMKDSKVIVAINKDEDAPIFQIATYGLVGDLFELIPQFIEQLKQR